MRSLVAEIFSRRAGKTERYREDADMVRLRGYDPLPDNRVNTVRLDKTTPFDAESDFVPSDAQARLARLETMLADHARSEGRTPYGSAEQQLAEVLDRLHEQSDRDI